MHGSVNMGSSSDLDVGEEPVATSFIMGNVMVVIRGSHTPSMLPVGIYAWAMQGAETKYSA